eukprot:6189499-Pleurochrysis_carterae.AAC.1
MEAANRAGTRTRTRTHTPSCSFHTQGGIRTHAFSSINTAPRARQTAMLSSPEPRRTGGRVSFRKDLNAQRLQPCRAQMFAHSPTATARSKPLIHRLQLRTIRLSIPSTIAESDADTDCFMEFAIGTQHSVANPWICVMKFVSGHLTPEQNFGVTCKSARRSKPPNPQSRAPRAFQA